MSSSGALKKKTECRHHQTRPRSFRREMIRYLLHGLVRQSTTKISARDAEQQWMEISRAGHCEIHSSGDAIHWKSQSFSKSRGFLVRVANSTSTHVGRANKTFKRYGNFLSCNFGCLFRANDMGTEIKPRNGHEHQRWSNLCGQILLSFHTLLCHRVAIVL